MNEFLAGVAEIVITPPPGLKMAGFAERAGPATGTHDELYARAAVFDCRNGRKSAVCVVDVCELDAEIVAAVRQRATHNAIRPERLMLAATHTHSGPSLDCDNELNQRWRKELEERLAEVIMMADVARRPALVGAAAGAVAGVGGNRRDPVNGPVDRAVNVMRLDDARTGKTMGVIVNHACHATTLDLKNLLYTADYPGQVCARVRAGLPDRPVVLFLNGACGDINPGGYSAEDSALGRPIPNRTFERSARIGAIIGDEAVRLVHAIQPRGEFNVRGGNLPLRLPVRDGMLPAAAQRIYAAALEKLQSARDCGADQAEIDRLRLEAVYAGCERNYAQRRFKLPNGELTTELQGIVVGDAVFLGLPGEVFNEIGAAIKARSPFANTFLVGYANDDAGYFPTVDALKQGGYEVKTSMFGDVAINRLQGWSGLLLRGLFDSEAAGLTGAAGAVRPAAAAPAGVLFMRRAPEHHPVPAARFPAIDFHMHYSGHRFDPAAALAAMDAANVRYGVNLIGDSLRTAALEPYRLPPPVRDRILIFGGLDFRRLDAPDWKDYVCRKLDQDIQAGARGLKIFKELGLVYRDSRGNLVAPTDSRLAPVWRAAAERNLPVLYHIADPLRSFRPIAGNYAELRALDDAALNWRWGAPGYPSHAALLREQEQLALAQPATTFIFAHLAACEADLPACGALLDKCPNVYVDTAARLFELGRQPVSARELFMRHAGRILWGTDYSCPNQYDGYCRWFQFLETDDEWFPANEFDHAFNIYGLNLPDDVLRKVYGENAARLLKLEWPAGG